ncbi:glycosyltransferase [Bacillus swezeyi]|uniref:UDP-glucosyltransferase n=1 Tax=Bacillus swezeyi TaxID=1925020 RepID=A0A1R1QII4_9BACI|nr:macrolide family glycosyltransferase [Bacillus swezeyi]MEC1259595.1 glycosyltransferase [Bacillus swezeyi]MED2927442.1 glycosyltransferase [Bacillus swezeyi]MED2941694.1 glycosyltransferase [Bacillus swezeyi]MED2962640.1 glycosyltransferase [Bacillus swezeyi]MED3071905.1 glycosyltransferase [Bacillus swezeyi]
MANVLMINVPAEGHVNPTLGIAKAFVERGDNVHYITTDKFKERLEGVGVNVHLQPDLMGMLKGEDSVLKLFIRIAQDTLRIVKQLADEIEFDFVYYDTFGAGKLVRDYLGVPGISSSASFLFNEEFMKSHGPIKAAQGDPEVEVLMREIEEQYGVEPESPVQFMRNDAELNIVCTSRYFQPESELFGDQYVFVGPTFPERKSSDRFPFEALEGERVLYISMGTILDNKEAFFNTCIDAFSDFKGKVVIAAGEKTDHHQLKKAPDHFIISPYVPQLEVLKQADAFITHGGMNSVNEAIHFEVPLVVIPHDKDQPIVAKRLAELGAGYPLAEDKVSPESLKAAVSEVLSTESYTRGIHKIKDSFRESGGAKRALEAIDRFVEEKNVSPDMYSV